MATTLVIDIGNSNIVLGLYQDGRWKHVFRYPSHNVQPSSFYGHGLQEVLLEWQIHPSDVQQVSVSSVVPDITSILEQELRSIIGSSPVIMGPELYERLPFSVPQPYTIGSDLVSNALAVHHRWQETTIIVDFGTALTFTLYRAGKGIDGVTIAPGIRTAIRSLAGDTAQLPEADIALPASVIGKNTTHAIQAGVLHGYTGLVKHIVQQVQQEIGEDCKVVATGGMATQLPLEDCVDVIDKHLTLDGIRLAGTY